MRVGDDVVAIAMSLSLARLRRSRPSRGGSGVVCWREHVERDALACNDADHCVLPLPRLKIRRLASAAVRCRQLMAAVADVGEILTRS